MTLGPTTCITCGATFRRVRVPYTTCPDCRLAALRPRTAEPPADLDNYDRARDERHEAELERRES